MSFWRYRRYRQTYDRRTWHDMTWHDMTWHDMTDRNANVQKKERNERFKTVNALNQKTRSKCLASMCNQVEITYDCSSLWMDGGTISVCQFFRTICPVQERVNARSRCPFLYRTYSKKLQLVSASILSSASWVECHLLNCIARTFATMFSLFPELQSLACRRINPDYKNVDDWQHNVLNVDLMIIIYTIRANIGSDNSTGSILRFVKLSRFHRFKNVI